jgi:hypothetical protein
MPWYRALLTRTPRGRRLRRRTFITFAVLTSWYWIPQAIGWSPRVTAEHLGLIYEPPERRATRLALMSPEERAREPPPQPPPPPKPCQYSDECGELVCDGYMVPACIRDGNGKGGCWCTVDLREFWRKKLAAEGLVCDEPNREGLAMCQRIDAGREERGDP